MPRRKALLKPFDYNTTFPITVRQAALLNATKDLTAKVVFDELQSIIMINSKKTKTDEIDAANYILKQDSNWIKKMFMGNKPLILPKKKVPKNKINKKPKGDLENKKST